MILHHLLRTRCTGQNMPGKIESKKSPSRALYWGPGRTAQVARPALGSPVHCLQDSKSTHPRLKYHGGPHSLLNKLRSCGGKGTLIHCGWECKWVQPLWRTVRQFLKNLNIELPYHPAIPHLGVYQKKNKNTNLKRYIWPSVHSSIIYNGQDMEAM